jgi:aspartyl-tRNA(Asn)/glutamyl-tRNA(Gln) amidotransferase subunit A
MSLFEHKVSELHELLHKKEISVGDLVNESYERINQVEDKVKSFLTLNEEKARLQAKELDDKHADGKGILAGMPIGLKDNIVTKNLRTTSGSKIKHG